MVCKSRLDQETQGNYEKEYRYIDLIIKKAEPFFMASLVTREKEGIITKSVYS